MSEQLTLVAYELLDAHEDTARLAADLAFDWRWQAHLGYLRDLQRLAREALAQASAEGPSGKTLPPAQSAPGQPRSCQRTHRANHGWQFQSNAVRRATGRCARDGHDEGPT